MNKRKVSTVASFFLGSPVALILPGVLMQAGVPLWVSLAAGPVVAVLLGRAVLSRI